MAGTVQFVLALHDHQPIGNFDGVFEQAYQDAYLPFLDVMQDYPDLPFALHTSGSLMEWLEVRRPEYVERLRGLVQSAQVEIIGGAYFEPILSNIPRRDRVGQIQRYSDHLNQLFGTSVRGMWLPERVWEQTFASDISAAGIEYTIVDDYHFRCAGLPPQELFGYYITEDEGRLLNVFPGSERIRYLIPFSEIEDCSAFLRQVADTHENAVVIFADDGEKLGSWPETHQHVYRDRWLRRFLDMLRENESWIKVTTPSRIIDQLAPTGRIYLPDASYREMTEWVLPTETQKSFVSLTNRHKDNDEWQQLVRFTRGGMWRNFRTRYPESNEMYARMVTVSSRLATLQSDPQVAGSHTDDLEQARLHLYRSQCNCSYWHGAFGGLYLPHLRNAVYHELIEADACLDRITRHDDRWIDVDTGDFNLDGREEVRLENHRLAAWLRPATGGHLYELDVRRAGINLLATLDRRPEPYHQRIIRHLNPDSVAAEEDQFLAAISDTVKMKQPNLDKKLFTDRWPRKSLVDHFFAPQLTADEFRRGEGLLGDFATGTYEASIRRGDSRIAVEQRRRGTVAGVSGDVRKVVMMSTDHPNEILIQYQVSGFPGDLPLHLGIELNFAAMPGGADDRYFYDATGTRLGTLDQCLSIRNTDRISLVDEWLGLDVTVEMSQSGGLWTMPIETVSQSEGGFEAVHQSVCIVPHWEFRIPESGVWTVELRLILDTSIAAARQLAEHSVNNDRSIAGTLS